MDTIPVHMSYFNCQDIELAMLHSIVGKLCSETNKISDCKFNSLSCSNYTAAWKTVKFGKVPNCSQK